jgi:multidrug efflux pump subunit AcrA (membrane-fusion protein)
MNEGEVLAPIAGRALRVPLTAGSVVMPGDPVAEIAEGDYILRLRVPERQAAFLKAGGVVRVDRRDLGGAGAAFATISLVYPLIEDGRVLADASAPGIGDYFVGQRVRVWIAVGKRWSYRIPAGFVVTLDGLSYVRRVFEGRTFDSPIQLGRDLPSPTMPDGVEVLSGLHPGDVLVHP